MPSHKTKLLDALQRRYPDTEFALGGNDPLHLHVKVNDVDTPVRVQPQQLIDEIVRKHMAPLAVNADVEAEILAATILEVARYIRPEDAVWRP